MSSRRFQPRLWAGLIACAAGLAAGTLAARAASEHYSIDVTRVDAEPKIDGTLNDPQWQKAAHVQLGWDIQFQRPAAQKTDAYVMADAHYLYVAFVAEQKEPLTT